MKAGEIIRHEREKRSLSQQRLADLTGIHQPTIANIELGRRNATDKQKVAIANCFKLPIEYIFFNDNYNK